MKRESENAVSVIGLGKLGAPLAACLAHKGYQVIGVDSNPHTVQLINEGRSPVFEPGLEAMIQANRKKLLATTDYHKAISETGITFIIVPTPSNDQGTFSHRFVLDACDQIGKALRGKSDRHLIVLTSTVTPGATENEVKPVLENRSGKRCGPEFGLCYSPEFIALGSVLRDMLNPDMVLIGESDPHSGDTLEAVYRRLCDNQPSVARMNFVNAELTKLAVNTYVTTKITFANMIARICEHLPGSNVDIVTSALGLDSRIGRKYLSGAIGYGGPCFPRDNRALSSFAQQIGTRATLAEATEAANNQQVSYLAQLVKSKLKPNGVVGILGLAYKPDTNVVERSQGILLAQALLEDHIPVITYDPEGMDNARKTLKKTVQFAISMKECVLKSDVVVITTPWREFSDIPFQALERNSVPPPIIDCWRCLDGERYRGITEYIGLGIGKTRISDKSRG